MIAARAIHPPEVGAASVLHDVHEIALVDHEISISTDLRVTGPADVEYITGLEQARGLPGITGCGGGCQARIEEASEKSSP